MQRQSVGRVVCCSDADAPRGDDALSDLDRLREEAATKAALAVGRDAAKRAVDQLLSGEDSAVSTEDAAADSKSRRWKIIASVVLGVCLLVGVLGLLLNYWLYFLAAGLLGVGGLIGWSRLKKRVGARKIANDTKTSAKERTPLIEPVRVRLEAPPAAPAAPDALEEAHAMREQEVDDELAAMKARLKR